MEQFDIPNYKSNCVLRIGDNCGQYVTRQMNAYLAEAGFEHLLPEENLGVGIPNFLGEKYGVPVLSKDKITPEILKALGPGTVIAYDRGENDYGREFGPNHAEMTMINPENGRLMVASKSAGKGILWKEITPKYIKTLGYNARAANPFYKGESEGGVLAAIGKLVGPSQAHAAEAPPRQAEVFDIPGYKASDEQSGVFDIPNYQDAGVFDIPGYQPQSAEPGDVAMGATDQTIADFVNPPQDTVPAQPDGAAVFDAIKDSFRQVQVMQGLGAPPEYAEPKPFTPRPFPGQPGYAEISAGDQKPPTISAAAPEEVQAANAPTPQELAEPGVLNTLNRFAANANRPILDVVHGFARALEGVLNLPVQLATGDDRAAIHPLTAATGKLKELGSPDKLIQESSPINQYLGGLLGGLASYMLPGGIMGKLGAPLPMATTLQRFGSNLLTFSTTDALRTAGEGGTMKDVQGAVIKSVPTAALFTVAQSLPYDKLVNSPYLTKALESVGTGGAFAATHALVGGDTDPGALAVSFLTGFGLHALTSGKPNMTEEQFQRYIDNRWKKFVAEHKEVAKENLDAARAILDGIEQPKTSHEAVRGQAQDEVAGGQAQNPLQDKIGPPAPSGEAVAGGGVMTPEVLPETKYQPEDMVDSEGKQGTIARAEFDPKLNETRSALEDAGGGTRGALGEDGMIGALQLPEVQPPQNAPGANYQGMIVDVYNPVAVSEAAQNPPQPKTRESILKPLLKHFGVPLYQGRVRGSKRLGFYRPKKEEVRVKKMSDLEVTSHELAHLLQDRDPAFTGLYIGKGVPRNVTQEVRALSYDDRKIHEGGAEFVRLWMTQPKEALARAPMMYSRFEAYLDKSPHGKALREAQKSMTEWYEQDALTRMRSKQGYQEDVNDFLNSYSDKFRQSVLDDLWGIAVAETTLKGRTKPGGMYETARLTRGLGKVMKGMVEIGAPKRLPGGRIVFLDKDGNPSVLQTVKPDGKIELQFNPKYKPWGLKQIFEPVRDDVANWGSYAVARRAEKLKAEGRENLFTNAEIKAGLALETPVFREVFDNWNKFNKQMLDFAQDAGVINPETRKLYDNGVYIPFYRADKQLGSGGKGKGIFKPIKRLFGGTSNIGNPIENIFKNSTLLLRTAVMNHARRQVVDEIMESQGSARFLAKIPTDIKSVSIEREQLKRNFAKNLKEMIGAEEYAQIKDLVDSHFAAIEPFVKFWQTGQEPHGENVIAVMRDGKAEYYEVADPLLFRALQALPRPIRQDIVKRVLSVPFKVIRGTITNSLGFMIRNFVRDPMMASTMSKLGHKPYVDSVRGIVSRLTEDPYYHEWLANGGGFASIYEETRNSTRDLDKFYRQRGIVGKMVIDTPAKMFTFLSQVGEVVEVGTRLGEFQRGIKQGLKSSTAALESREISTDFALRGDQAYLGFLYDTVPFLKAGIEGLDRVYRGLTTQTNRAVVAAKVAALAAASTIIYLHNRDNPLYQRLEDWDKDSYWHLFIPTKEALTTMIQTGSLPSSNPEDLYHHFRLPKPWEVGIMGSMAERTMEGFLEGKPVEWSANMLRLVWQMLRYDVLPAGGQILLDQYSNNLSFFNRPIETPDMQQLEPWARSGPYNSRTLRWVGEKGIRQLPKGLQISPARLEALLRGFFNSWAATGLQIADGMFFDDVPALRVEDYPGIASFYRQEPSRHTKYETMFYDMVKNANEARRTIREMDRTYRTGYADELENSPDNQEYKYLTKAEKVVQSYRREMLDIIYMPDLETTRKYAATLAHDKEFSKPIYKIMKSEAWNNLPILKRDLLELWIQKRNLYLEEVVKNSEKERRK